MQIDSEFFDQTLRLNANLGFEPLFPFQIDLSNSKLSVEISTESLELEEIDLIYDRLPHFEGTIAGFIQGHGPFRDPRFSLTAGVTRIAYQEQELGQGRIQGVIEERVPFPVTRLIRSTLETWENFFPFLG